MLYSGMVSRNSLLALVNSVSRSTEICIHPGFPAPKHVPYYPQTAYNDFIVSNARKIEHDILIDESVQTAARRLGLTLRAYVGEPKR